MGRVIQHPAHDPRNLAPDDAAMVRRLDLIEILANVDRAIGQESTSSSTSVLDSSHS